MNNIKKCGRCGEEYKEYNKNDRNGFRFSSYEYERMTNHIDLCPKCMGSLNTWWHNGKIHRGENL